MTNNLHTCPICKSKLEHITSIVMPANTKITCPNCGKYQFSWEYYEDFLDGTRLKNHQLGILSYAIWRMNGNGPPPLISEEIASNIMKSTTLPTASEQLDNLVLFLGQTLSEPGQTMSNVYPDTMRAKLGSVTKEASEWVIEQAIESKLVQGKMHKSIDGSALLSGATLSIKGWQRFAELQTSVSGQKRAFMAMQFGDPELENVFVNYFKKAARAAGYELFKLDEQPRAGLIDDRLRLDIRTSRFLIADLTHANKGAYWEAGYAEGLGRPVIYTCKQEIFDSQDYQVRPHFDTNHYLIVPWDPNDLQKAADKLTTTIRVTLPSEAILAND